MALLAGTSSELSVLGPVGFYLMHQVGSAWLLVLGLLWPLVCGAAWWCAALLSFRRADIV